MKTDIEALIYVYIYGKESPFFPTGKQDPKIFSEQTAGSRYPIMTNQSNN